MPIGKVVRPDLADFWAFCERLHRPPGTTRPPFTPSEKRWLRVLRKVAGRFWYVPRDTSYDLSTDALRQCVGQGQGANLPYVYRACVRSHQRLIRQELRRRRLRTGRAYGTLRFEVQWDAIDARLDLEEALVGLPGHQAQALRMKAACQTEQQMADALGVCDRQVRRVLRQAEEHLRRRLRDGYGEPEPGLRRAA